MAIGSGLAHSAVASQGIIHVLDAGLSKGLRREVKDLVARLRPGWTVRTHPVDLSAYTFLPTKPLPAVAFARLLLPELVEAPRILYLDADVLVNRDLAPLFASPLDGALAGVVRDPHNPTKATVIGEPCASFELEPGSACFHSGVMLIDLDGWRREPISRKVLDLYRQPGFAVRHADQCGLNIVLDGRVTLLDSCWNAAYSRYDAPTDDWQEAGVIHFFSPGKPWMQYHDSFAGRLSECQARSLGIALKRDFGYWKSYLSRRLKLAFVGILPPVYRLRARLKALLGRHEDSAMDRHVARSWADYRARDYRNELQAYRSRIETLL